MRSFARQNPSLAFLLALAPGLLLTEAGATGLGLALELGLAAALAATGARRHGAALAILACLLLPRTCAARDARRAELGAWRAEPAGPLVLVGRAEAGGVVGEARGAYLFRVAARAAPGEAPRPRTGWVRLRTLVATETGATDHPRRIGDPSAEVLDALPIGRVVEVQGRFRPFGAPENPGSLDWGALAGGPRLRGSLTVSSWRELPGRSPLLQGLRERLSAQIEQLFPPLSGGFMQAALFGDRERLDPRLREVFRRTGTGHIVAISGMNVAILAAIGWAVLTPIVPSLQRRRRALALGLLLYVPLAGNSPSVARAALMAVGLLCARSAARRVLLPNALGAAGLTLLALQPGSLLDPSFQLSFVAVLGLAFLPDLPGGRWNERTGPPTGLGIVGRAVRAGTAAAVDLSVVTLASLAGTLSFTLGYFRHFPVLSLPANLVVVPTLGILTAGGFAALLASLACDPLARLYARACDVLLGLVFRALEICSAPAWAWPAVPGPRLLLAAGGASVSALALLALRVPRARAATAAALLLLAVVVPAALQPRASGKMEVAVLSVGQGDAIVLLLPGDEALVVDGGPPDAGEAVVAFLQERGVRRLRRAFATHPDGDHTGGFARILGAVPADSVHDGAQWGAGSPYRRFLESSYAAGAGYRPLTAGERLRYGEVTLDVLWPPPGFAGRDPYWEGFATNDASLVLLIGYRGFRILLTGDAGGDVERRLAAVYGDSLRSGFLKVSHHGSRFSSVEEFVREVRAPVALISVGRDNRYGHPSREALIRLGRSTRIWRTDREGALLLVTDGRRYELSGYASGWVERGALPLAPLEESAHEPVRGVQHGARGVQLRRVSGHGGALQQLRPAADAAADLHHDHVAAGEAHAPYADQLELRDAAHDRPQRGERRSTGCPQETVGVDRELGASLVASLIRALQDDMRAEHVPRALVGGIDQSEASAPTADLRRVQGPGLVGNKRKSLARRGLRGSLAFRSKSRRAPGSAGSSGHALQSRTGPAPSHTTLDGDLTLGADGTSARQRVPTRSGAAPGPSMDRGPA
jgi:competence protein ComEC